MMERGRLTRRRLLEAAAGAVALSWGGPLSASQAADDALSAVTKGLPVTKGRVTLSIPAIAENGLSVFTAIAVESPMTEDDYVKTIHLISEKNPVPIIASFFFTPAMAEAKVSTNIRLADSQKVTAIAIMNDGSVWSGEKNIVVAIAACIDGG
jgi:sulfur-oxidizing protein SoxY